MYITVCATLVGLVAEPSWTWALYVCAPIFLVMLTMYCQVVIFKAWNWKLLHSKLDWVYLGTVCLLSGFFTTTTAHQLQLMFGLAMLAAQLPTLLIKIFASRLRPVVADALWLNAKIVPRIVHIHKFVDTPKEARESFPSGDAVGAGVFYGIIACHTQNPLWILPTLFTLFGRVYFWAHHVGDVSVGCGLGLGAAYLLHVLCAGTVLTIWHLAGSLPPFIIAYRSMSKFRGTTHPNATPTEVAKKVS
jgi:membrane-associated phospholipid phosphatase